MTPEERREARKIRAAEREIRRSARRAEFCMLVEDTLIRPALGCAFWILLLPIEVVVRVVDRER